MEYHYVVQRILATKVHLTKALFAEDLIFVSLYQIINLATYILPMLCHSHLVHAKESFMF